MLGDDEVLEFLRSLRAGTQRRQQSRMQEAASMRQQNQGRRGQR